MTEIEKKALALVRELQQEDEPDCGYSYRYYFDALCRAIEQHEEFRQQVSDAVEKLLGWPSIVSQGVIGSHLGRFIVPKPDPLVNMLYDMGCNVTGDEMREALAKRGGKIVWEDA